MADQLLRVAGTGKRGVLDRSIAMTLARNRVNCLSTAQINHANELSGRFWLHATVRQVAQALATLAGSENSDSILTMA